MGNPKLPTELKRQRGTLNVTREKENPSADVLLAHTSVIVQPGDKVPGPKHLTTCEGKKFYKLMIKNLNALHVLSLADIPQIETMARYLERMREIDKIIKSLDPASEDDIDLYDKYDKIYGRLTTQFNNLAAKYYISPQARVQLKLNELNAIKTGIEVAKEGSAISNLLSKRKAAD